MKVQKKESTVTLYVGFLHLGWNVEVRLSLGYMWQVSIEKSKPHHYDLCELKLPDPTVMSIPDNTPLWEFFGKMDFLRIRGLMQKVLSAEILLAHYLKDEDEDSNHYIERVLSKF